MSLPFVVGPVVASLLALGCSASPAATIVVRVDKSDGIALPGEADDDNSKIKIDHLVLQIRNGDPEAGDRVSFEQTYLLGIDRTAEPDAVRLPASLGIELKPDHPAFLTAEAIGYHGETQIVSRTKRVDLGEAREDRIDLVLDRRCALTECAEGKTCVPELGCKALIPGSLVDGGSEDGATGGEPEGPTKPNGLPCNCESYFPFCVGATWDYLVCDPLRMEQCSDAAINIKRWVITDAQDLPHGGDTVPTYVLVRLTSDAFVRKWLTLKEGRLVWLRNDTFSPDWKPTGLTYYVPEKLRLDESHLASGDAWPPLQYKEIVLEGPNDVEIDIREHVDTWEVVSASTIPDLTKHGVPEGYLAGLDVLCHRRIDRVASDSKLNKDATYCFAKGIGKIFEVTAGNEIEWLVGSTIPSPSGAGCRSFPPSASP